MFATAVPGLATVLSDELAAIPDVKVTGSGSDGRADVVLFEAERDSIPAVRALRTAEDVFIEVGRTMRTSGDQANWIAGRVWKPERVQRALSIWGQYGGGRGKAITFRVIARVLQERSFLRSELRRQLTHVVSRDRPQWKENDPAPLEIWISEYAAGRLVSGFRLSTASMRQHDGRQVERAGALRPTVAAAMISLAGDRTGILVDPCCGSGTILAEAHAAGWHVIGSDIDSKAVDTARRNVPSAKLTRSDARHIDQQDGSVRAVVSNLPFGQQFEVDAGMDAWLVEVLTELARITESGGRVVLLAPKIPRTGIPRSLRLRARHPLRLLGTPTAIWVYDKK